MEKQKTSYALTDDAKGLIRNLARKLGLQQSSVIELAVRLLARREGVTATAPADDAQTAWGGNKGEKRDT